MGDLIAASTTDPLSEVRRTVGLSPEPSPEEKREAEEINEARVENSNRSPIEKMQQRINQIRAQKGEAERERDFWRDRAEELERGPTNAPLDRALTAEARVAELEERLRRYDQHGADGYANAPPASTEEQPSLEQTHVEAAPAEESQQQPVNDSLPPEMAAFQDRHNRKLGEILSKRSDANELIAHAAPIIQQMGPEVDAAITAALKNSPNSEQVMLYFFEHSDELKQANQLSPEDAYNRTLRLAGRLETNGQPRTVPVSHAPPPIRPLSGNARATVEKDPGDMSLGEYRAWYDRNYGRGRR